MNGTIQIMGRGERGILRRSIERLLCKKVGWGGSRSEGWGGERERLSGSGEKMIL